MLVLNYLVKIDSLEVLYREFVLARLLCMSVITLDKKVHP